MSDLAVEQPPTIEVTPPVVIARGVFWHKVSLTEDDAQDDSAQDAMELARSEGLAGNATLGW